MKILSLNITVLLFLSSICIGQQKDVKQLSNSIRHFDTSVNGIIYSDKNSFLKRFGNKHAFIDSITECLFIANQDKTELLILHHENGGDSNSYDEFQVQKLVNNRKFISSKEKHFVSTKGAHIGMPLIDFLKRYHDLHFETEVKGGYMIYKYYNPYETYYAIYTFSKRKLFSYGFGYDHS